MKYLLFHGTTKKNAARILEKGFNLSLSKLEDKTKHWLGNGVYFYDNKNFAQQWVSYQSDACVLENEIIVDNNYILDITKAQDSTSLYQYAKELEKACLINEELDVNTRRFILIEAYCRTKNIYLVISHLFRDPNGEKTKHMFSYGIPINIDKQFCLKNIKCIKNTKICAMYDTII